MDVRSSPRSSVFRLRDRILKALRNPALATGGYIPNVNLADIDNPPGNMTPEEYIHYV